jgi:hypothetical protein
MFTDTSTAAGRDTHATFFAEQFFIGHPDAVHERAVSVKVRPGVSITESDAL